MSNRNLFGSAQVLIAPFVAFVLYKGGKGWKYVAALAILVIIVSVVIFQTRSAGLALITFIVASLILGGIFLFPNPRKGRRITVLACILLFAAVVVFF